MFKARICFEIMGLSHDDDGNPCATGMEIEIGESEKEIPYEVLTKDINIPGILKMSLLDGYVKPENVTIITPKEYDERYREA